MRWEQLFADLEAWAEANERAGFDADVADRGRAERSALRLVDRLLPHAQARLTFLLVNGDRVAGAVSDVGTDWVLLEDGASVLLPLAAVVGIEGLSRLATPDDGPLVRRVRLTVVLRRLCRDRAVVRLALSDGSTLSGTIDRVGADHLDLAQHPLGEARRPGAVRGVRLVPVHALVQVRAAG